MNRKQKIIVSTTGIFLVLLILVGLTYAYFLTRINGNTNDKSISVTTANLRLVYNDGTDGVIGGTNIEPSDTVYTKTFTVKSEGNKNIEYGVYLINVINQLTRKEDVKYTLECTTDGTIKCNGVNETTFPSGISQLITNTIEPGKTHTYTFKFTYKDTGTDQSIDMGKELSAKIQIFGKLPSGEYFPYEEGTLSYNIINNAKNNLNGTIYSEVPLTTPGESNSKIKYKTTTSEEEQESTMQIETTYQSYYWTYISDYTIDEETGLFIAKGVGTCKYDDGTCNKTLEGKYLLNNSHPYPNTSETDKAKDTSYIHMLYKVIEAPSNSSSTITMRLKKLKFPEAYSVEKTLSKTIDTYGNTYYYRGGVEDNYVNFAGMCWKIIRIAGDGSIKLILDNQTTTCEKTNGVSDSIIGTGNFGIEGDRICNQDGCTGKNIPNYINPTKSENAMSTAFENFQKNKLSTYLSKLKSGDWCYDDDTGLTEEELNNYYNNISSISYIDYGLDSRNTNVCKKTISKFNDNENMYVGTITYYESLCAGNMPADKTTASYSNFLKGPTDSWHTLTLGYYMQSARTFSPYIINADLGVFKGNMITTSSKFGFRPSIQLKANTLISKGTGTISDPYEIK